MADLNSIVIIGRATKDTELRTTTGGAKVATVTIANNRANDTADFFDVVLFDQRAEFAAKYITKGRQISVSGRLQNRNFEKDGVKHYRTEIVGYQIQLLDKSNAPMTQAQSGGKDYVVGTGSELTEDEIDSIPF